MACTVELPVLPQIPILNLRLIMDSEEKEIFEYLKTFGDQFVAAREICRRAGGRKKYDKSPHWAMALLPMMVDKEILESDSSARYRIRMERKKSKEKHWLAPHIKKILEEKGVDPHKAVDIEAAPSPK